MDVAAGTKLLNAGVIGSSLVASICCVGPIALAVLGVGGGAVLLKFEPYRPYFLGATGLFLAGAFYLAYRRQKDCDLDSPCFSPTTRRRQMITLWFVTVIAVLAALFPYLSNALF